MRRTRLSCAKTYPPLKRQTGTDGTRQPFFWRPQEATMVEHSTSCILTKCAGGSTAAAASGDSQQAAAANAVYVEATVRATYQKGIGVFENISSATDLASRSFGLLVGDGGLVDGDVKTPFRQQNLLRHLGTPLVRGLRLGWLIIGWIFGN